MSLPTFDIPRFNVQLPSTGETVQFRPFLVKEQKQLLMAVANDNQEQISAIENIIHACSFGKVQARRLPAFDVEYLFLQIRARSIGEHVDMVLTCDCGEKTKAVLDITKVAVKHTEGHTANIDLGSGIIVQMRYPRLTEIEEFGESPSVDTTIALIARCIQSIWQGEEMFAADDYSPEELIEFVENLRPGNLDTIEEFFNTMPVLQHRLEWNCKACGKDNDVVVEGMQSFFG
jgi:hypothetical protein